jgi:anion-transporting  ArsA/GET3 family ATPase
MTARMHVFVGAGGVGKTTLAAGYALALGRAGAKVALLGIDPARRLQSALGIALGDLAVTVPEAKNVDAALLRPEDSLRRWAAEALPDGDTRDRLLANPFFLALADRLAGATDIFAAVRLVEWAEGDPSRTDFVVDTAPGLNAIEFLRRPQTLSAFLEGRLVGWLRWLASQGAEGGQHHGVLGAGAQRVLGGLRRLTGARMVIELSEFVWLVERVFANMLVRLARAQAWLKSDATRVLLVTAVRDDAARSVRSMSEALAAVGITPRAIVVNRAVPDGLGPELDALAPAAITPAAATVVAYARAYAAMQARVLGGVADLAPAVLRVPAMRGLTEASRVETLTLLGDRLLRARAPEPAR